MREKQTNKITENNNVSENESLDLVSKSSCNDTQEIDTSETNKIEQLLKNLHVGQSRKIKLIDADRIYSDIVSGMNQCKVGFYDVKNNQREIIITRLTDFNMRLTKKVCSYNYNFPDTKDLAYIFTINHGNEKIEVRIPVSLVSTPNKIMSLIVSKIFINPTLLTDKQIKTLISMVLNEINNVEIVYEYQTAGYNLYNGQEIFVTADSVLPYNSEINLQNGLIKLSEESRLKPQFISFDEVMSDIRNNITPFSSTITSMSDFVSELLRRLFKTISLTYNNRLEPFLVLSMGILTVFLKQISNDFSACPVVVLYGETASGKSTLLRNGVHLYGLNEGELHSGGDTIAALRNDLSDFVNVPIVIDDIEGSLVRPLATLLKSIYEQTARRKHKEYTKINTTIFVNTNDKLSSSPEHRNRYIELKFYTDNFKPTEAEKLKSLHKYLSCITEYVIKNIPYEDIKTSIKTIEGMDMLSSIQDVRMKRNLSIALAGLNLLITLANDDSITLDSFKDRIENYISETSNVEINNINMFITTLKKLIDSKQYFQENRDYKITDYGIHIIISEKNSTFRQHFNKVFSDIYKGEKPLDIKMCKKILENQGAVMENQRYVKYNKSLYGLFLPFKHFGDLRYLNPSYSEPTDELGYSTVYKGTINIAPF